MLVPACVVILLTFTVLQGNALDNTLGKFSTPTGVSNFNIAMIGSKSTFGRMLLDQDFVVTEDVHNMENWEKVALLYLNADTGLYNHDFAIASNAVRAGVPVLIDGTADYNPSIMQSISARIGGVGFSDPLIMIRKSPGKVPEYKVMFDEEIATECAATEESKEEELSKLVVLAEKYLNQWFEDDQALNQEIQSGGYRPEATIAVELSGTFNCKVGANYAGSGLDGYWTSEWIEDACNGGGRVSLFFTIDLVRSVPISPAEDAKYVRITLDPKTAGGAGWHLVDNPTHKHTWWQSWSNRNCLFYPIVLDYNMQVYTNDNSVRLYNSVPNNHGREEDVTDTTSFSVGVEAGAEAGVGADGPKAGVSVKGSLQYSSSRSVSYKVYEYTITNQGSTNMAKWTWDRKWAQYSAEWRTHGTAPLWNSEWFWKDSKFTGAAYANYKPGFSATFRATPDKTGTTRFTIKASAGIYSLGGRIQYSVWFSTFSPYSANGHIYPFTKSFDIHWDGPIFQPEVPVSIEPEYPGATVYCLDVLDGHDTPGTAVVHYGCHYAKNQLFALDQYQRYKALVGPNRCMEAKSDGRVTVEACSTSSQYQRWEWSGNNLKNKAGGGYLAIAGGKIRVTTDTSASRIFKPKIRRPGISGSITVR